MLLLLLSEFPLFEFSLKICEEIEQINIVNMCMQISKLIGVLESAILLLQWCGIFQWQTVKLFFRDIILLGMNH